MHSGFLNIVGRHRGIEDLTIRFPLNPVKAINSVPHGGNDNSRLIKLVFLQLSTLMISLLSVGLLKTRWYFSCGENEYAEVKL